MAYRFHDFKNYQTTKLIDYYLNVEANDNSKKQSDSKMVKNRQHKNGRKFSHTSSILSTGDQELISSGKAKYQNNKTPVYVHDFKTNNFNIHNPYGLSHFNVYNHGFQDLVTSRGQILKSKFDSLTLINKNKNSNNNHITLNSQTKSHSSKYSNLTIGSRQESAFHPNKSKLKEIKDESIDEDIISKLEESYWANWKPNRSTKKTKQHIKKSVEKIYTEPEHRYNIYEQINAEEEKHISSQFQTPTKQFCSLASLLKDFQATPPATDTSTPVELNEPEVSSNDTPKISFEEQEEDTKTPSPIISEVKVITSEKAVEYLHEPNENITQSNTSENEICLLFNEEENKNESQATMSNKTKSTDVVHDINSSNINSNDYNNNNIIDEEESHNSNTESNSKIPNEVQDIINFTSSGSSSYKIKKDIRTIEEKLSKTVTPHLTTPSSSQTSENEELPTIKHNDSFIITIKKHNVEKPHYPQPKCIKLQKNPQVTNRSQNYIKGGSYPLKSCLKKEKISSQSLVLGKPGSPMLLQPNKNKKFRKFK